MKREAPAWAAPVGGVVSLAGFCGGLVAAAGNLYGGLWGVIPGAVLLSFHGMLWRTADLSPAAKAWVTFGVLLLAGIVLDWVHIRLHADV